MSRNFKIFLLCSTLLLVILIFTAGMPTVSSLLSDHPDLVGVILLLIALPQLFFLRKARRTGEMPKSILGQFLYASIFGIFWRRRKDGDTENK